MQQHGGMVPIILLADTPTLDQNSTFSDHGYVAFQIKWNHECSNMVTYILSSPPPLKPGGGSKGKNSAFSEDGHVGHQIKFVASN